MKISLLLVYFFMFFCRILRARLCWSYCRCPGSLTSASSLRPRNKISHFFILYFTCSFSFCCLVHSSDWSCVWSVTRVLWGRESHLCLCQIYQRDRWQLTWEGRQLEVVFSALMISVSYSLTLISNSHLLCSCRSRYPWYSSFFIKWMELHR